MKIDRVKLISQMVRKEISVKDLADKAKISRATISAIRSGKRCSKVTLERIASALDMNPSDLLSDDQSA